MTLTAAQLEFRKSGISGTDVGAIVGVSPYSSPIDIWLQKRGEADPIKQNMAMEAGNRLEDAVANWYADIAKVHIRPCPTLRHGSEKWILATPDRVIINTGFNSKENVQFALMHRAWEHSSCTAEMPPFGYPGLFDGALEIKVVGPNSIHLWGEEGSDDVPMHYFCQAHWEMEILGVERIAVVALLGGTELRIYPLQRSEELITSLKDTCRRFWFEHVVAGVPPPIDGSASTKRWLERKFKNAGKTMRKSDADSEVWASVLRDAVQKEKQAKLVAEEARNHLRELIGEDAGIEGESWRATWYQRAGSVSWKGVAQELGAKDRKEIVEKHRGASSRVLTARFHGVEDEEETT